MRHLAYITMLICVAALTGCEMEYRVVRSSWDDLPIDPKPVQKAVNDRSSSDQLWAIRLHTFAGENRQANADRLIRRLLQEASVGNVWIDDHSGNATVYRGRFTDPRSDQARQLLEETRRITLDDQRPFSSATITPLTGAAHVIADPLNLKQYVGFYTLQIGFYDSNFQGDRHAAAEQAAIQLRREGHDAYYYHGPNRSLITIGLFTYNEAFTTQASRINKRTDVDAYSASIRELQKQFPYNLGNGLTLLEKRDGKDLGAQPSCLVRVF